MWPSPILRRLGKMSTSPFQHCSPFASFVSLISMKEAPERTGGGESASLSSLAESLEVISLRVDRSRHYPLTSDACTHDKVIVDRVAHGGTRQDAHALRDKRILRSHLLELHYTKHDVGEAVLLEL